jgi:alkyl sulfatase BDS1-like metallo-beta-lactamase superfamily hydrolase
MSAPLNAFRTVAVFAKKKIVFEGEITMQNTTERKDVHSRINAQTVERLDEIIDARELAKRWQVPQTWIRNWTREGYANDPIPHVKLGRYVRFEWGSRLLADWWEKRRR